MALKDKWVDRRNDEDFVLAEDINEVAHAVIQIEDNLKNNGGVSIELDTTLTQGGKAADAKAVGDALQVDEESLNAKLGEILVSDGTGDTGGTGGTGGGSNDVWEEIATVEVETAVRNVTINKDNGGNPFMLKDWRIIGTLVGRISDGTAIKASVSVNVKQDNGNVCEGYAALTTHSTTSNNGVTVGDLDGNIYACSAQGAGQNWSSGIKIGTLLKRFNPVVSVELYGLSVDNLIMGTITLYGVRA